MQLAKALGINPGESLAFSGAGGKTSAIFSLARNLAQPVVVTTTTHLGAWQSDLADEHQVVHTTDELNRIDFESERTVLITGAVGADNRLEGLTDDGLNRLRVICKQRQITMLIEADGAKQRYLKAPADYEPVLPPWIDHVLVMAGLGGLGKPLDERFVHRPELFSGLSSRAMGDLIQVEDLVRVLASARGGLKGIPEASRRSMFLNQAEGAILSVSGLRIARDLMDVYDRILIGSLQQPGEDGPIASVHARTAGVILAAGGSARLGEMKPLMDWMGKPFVFQVAQNAIFSGLSPVLVITGAQHAAVEEALAGLPVKCVHNPDWEGGQSTSMRVGLSHLPDRCDSVMFLLSDQPHISPFLIEQLRERYAQNRGAITAPQAGGRRANPVLFSRQTFEALGHVRGDQGGRAVFNQFDVDWLDWVDARILLDVDVPGDYEKLMEAYFSEE